MKREGRPAGWLAYTVAYSIVTFKLGVLVFVTVYLGQWISGYWIFRG